ncbi:hypothetical protein G7Y89_g15270 [Cudoniella acicularis]|uniref:Mitochondrial intermembrane space import and assembly protein 40 n=1 Tax=Cudoniella acicularis TaxID=354080 RepID=A0A8H4QRN5_9HELO|nr:hypothetical protein G7Y89_g15270 [Cudoniella acicularis]
MFNSAVRAAPRHILPSRAIIRNSPARRFLSTAPPLQKSRSWKSSAARWGLAAGGIYYYNTSNVFAEEPEAAIQRLDESIHHVQESNQPTLDAIVEEKRQRTAQRLAEEKQREQEAEAKMVLQEGGATEEEGGLDSLEEEADQQGAFNPETGEINWDCPCLGGMAHGPCGEEFKAAFSCFVYSNEEPKGVECIDKFKGMQDCFRQHPEMYGAELEDDEDEVEEELRAREQASSSGETVPQSETQSVPEPTKEATPVVGKKDVAAPHQDSKETTASEAQKAGDEGGELLPKAVHDASSK